MNALAVDLLGVAKEYLGPAAPAFLSRELVALGCNANTVESKHILALAERARLSASRVMDTKRAGEFAQALAAHGGRQSAPKMAGDHRLASDAAAKLFASGRLRQAEAAYRELIAKHSDAESYSGLARTLMSLEDAAAALNLLREGAASLARKGDRINAIALLGVAVDIAPSDLNAHRRLAAALANQGDLISACAEYARFVDVVLSQGDTRRALLELTYGRETLGDLPQLLSIADRVAAAQRASALVAARDGRAVETALDAARKLLALHKLQAASDVLLDLIGAGYRDREAHRLLIEVNCELGRREVAREKCALLGAVYRLDGQGAIAEDVERLAKIL